MCFYRNIEDDSANRNDKGFVIKGIDKEDTDTYHIAAHTVAMSSKLEHKSA